MQEEGLQFLEAEYSETLENAALIEAEIKHQPMRLSRLHNIVQQLFHERARFGGQTARDQSKAALKHCLQTYDGGIESVVFFFQQYVY
jgi:hypothetical protein